MTLQYFGLFLFSMGLFGVNVKGQNLIPNADFEKFTRCPKRFSSDGLTFWYSPTLGTPDYFNSCSTGSNGVPKNWSGTSASKSGEGYIGVALLNNIPSSIESYTQANSREYIQTRLNQPLKKDSTYCFTMYFKRASNSPYSINQIGVLLSKNNVGEKGFNQIMEKPQLNHEKHVLPASEWTKFCGQITSKGGEEYLTLGNFEYATNTDYKKIIPHNLEIIEQMRGIAYYWFDQLSLIPMPSIKGNCDCAIPRKENVEKKLITTKKILFDTGKYQLQSTSKKQAEILLKILKHKRNRTIKLIGHTDITGSTESNMILSQKRAQEIADYFIEKGIDVKRITIEWKGSFEPKAENKTEEGKAKNRRVECLVYEAIDVKSLR